MMTVPSDRPLWANELTRKKTEYNAPTDRLPKPQIVLYENSGALVIEHWRNIAENRSAMVMKAKKFTDLVEKGSTIKAAAEEVGCEVRLIKSAAEDYGARVQSVLDSHGWMTPELKRQTVRANHIRLMDAAMQAVETDPTDPKLLVAALQALKAVGDDKDVAIFKDKMAVAPVATQPELSPVLQALMEGVVVSDEHMEEPKDEEKAS